VIPGRALTSTVLEVYLITNNALQDSVLSGSTSLYYSPASDLRAHVCHLVVMVLLI